MHCLGSILATAVSVCLAVAGTQGLHTETVPLRGYECKQNAQRPCELCQQGYYCPSKYEKIHCGDASVFCEVGSVTPTQVSDGYYTITGDEKHRSEQRVCEAGFYCQEGVKYICPAGYFCPDVAMTTPLECGDPSKFCKEGSIRPELVTIGHYSVIGPPNTRSGQKIAPLAHYAKDGLLQECPKGHYGNTSGLTNGNCSGICEAGWYCPRASGSSRQIACGGEEYFCPEGSSSPRKVQHGYYTTKEWEPCRPGMYRTTPDDDYSDSLSPVNQTIEPGHCELFCPENTFKTNSGDGRDGCIECGPKARSTPHRMTCECYQSATQKLTAKFYFNITERSCIDITDRALLPPDEIYHPESQLTKSEEHKCEPGSYCIDGVRYLCPAGRYGDKYGETDKKCSGACKEGHYCPRGSSSSTQIECGSKPNVYCPESSDIPTYVNEGYFANEEDPTSTKTSQELCPPGYYCPGDGRRHKCQSGHFGENTGLVIPTCDGKCLSGYYCPPGSTSDRQVPCGNATVICTEGSSLPLPVQNGYYSTSSNNTLMVTHNYAGPNSTQDVALQCEVGYFCKEGVKFQCPGGTYGDSVGAGDSSACQICPPGHYCPSYPAPPTTHETIIPCGESYLYCPEGSPAPKEVDPGHYSIFNDITQGQANDESPHSIDRRTDQVLCPPGYYCQLGMRHKCRKGTYGEKSRLTDEDCSGLCPRGYFCPENTVNPLPCSPGAYSTGGAAECTSCEVPESVSMEVKNRMCRDARECCFGIFEEEE